MLVLRWVKDVDPVKEQILKRQEI